MKFILDVFVAFVKHFVIGKYLITFWYASNECKKQNCHQKLHQFCCVVHIYSHKCKLLDITNEGTWDNKTDAIWSLLEKCI